MKICLNQAFFNPSQLLPILVHKLRHHNVPDFLRFFYIQQFVFYWFVFIGRCLILPTPTCFAW
ncbi:hypothetical protein HMPREF3225_01863 [Staphylococcus lugdunensis]|uniref:Uncharacterized protein n=1 Tax=Staphylococcus lugdunensis TaxID=28035 RepID=A0ABD4EEA0_STALU|nr:hypothetical protein HMPREF3225_01863 [Staphylococcus lugdunensis]